MFVQPLKAKLLWPLGLLILLAGLLTACDSGAPSTATPVAPPSPTPAPTLAADQATTPAPSPAVTGEVYLRVRRPAPRRSIPRPASRPRPTR